MKWYYTFWGGAAVVVPILLILYYIIIYHILINNKTFRRMIQFQNVNIDTVNRIQHGYKYVLS